MSDYYLQFSEEVQELNQQEQEWWDRKIDELKSFADLENPTEEQEDMGDVACNFRSNFWNSRSGLPSVWVIAEENGNVETVAKVVQEFLKVHRPDDYFTLTWANTCSKPLLTAFSGGGVFVSANSIQYFNPSAQIQEAIEAHERSI